MKKSEILEERNIMEDTLNFVMKLLENKYPQVYQDVCNARLDRIEKHLENKK